ncbi:hypothetical protein D3C87_278630 [compost metagenome]
MHRLIRLDPSILESTYGKAANESTFAKGLAPSLSVITDNGKLRDGADSDPLQNFRTRTWRLNDDPVTRA